MKQIFTIFREFTPVSGERLTNELTAYLTGFFASSTEAMNARGQVRNTGYSDAFIVAYCDGKRIPYQVALNYENTYPELSQLQSCKQTQQRACSR